MRLRLVSIFLCLSMFLSAAPAYAADGGSGKKAAWRSFANQLMNNE